KDLAVDYSDSFLANEWNVTAVNGALQTRSDSASIAAFYKRSQSLTDLPVTSDTMAATVAAAMLAKYKSPMFRCTRMSPIIADRAYCLAVLPRELGDRIRVLRTPPGGGSRIDESLFIQKIEISGDASSPVWTVNWAVSPL